MSESFCVRNLKASEIFRHLIVLLRYFSKPILSFLDKNTLTSSLFSNNDLVRSSMTDDRGRNSLKRGTEYFHIFKSCCRV